MGQVRPLARQSAGRTKPGTTGKGNPWLASALGDAVKGAARTALEPIDRGSSLRERRPDVGCRELLELRAPYQRGQRSQDLPIRGDRLGRAAFEAMSQKVIDSILDGVPG